MRRNLKRPLLTWLTASLALHLGLAALPLFLSLRPEAEPSSEALIVELLRSAPPPRPSRPRVQPLPRATPPRPVPRPRPRPLQAASDTGEQPTEEGRARSVVVAEDESASPPALRPEPAPGLPDLSRAARRLVLEAAEGERPPSSVDGHFLTPTPGGGSGSCRGLDAWNRDCQGPLGAGDPWGGLGDRPGALATAPDPYCD